jgi:hypothetical protein
MSKYAIAKQCIADALAAAKAGNTAEDDVLEALIVLTVADFAKRVGGKRAGDVLRYELSNVGGDIDTVFLRSR